MEILMGIICFIIGICVGLSPKYIVIVKGNEESGLMVEFKGNLYWLVRVKETP